MATAGSQQGGLRIFDRAVAILTGGASGAGAARARARAARGAEVVLADRDEAGARAMAERIGAAGGRARAAGLDVRDAVAVERLVAEVWSTHGRLDYLFNNAGIGIGGEARHLALDDWRQVVEVNLMGPIHGVQAAYPRMVDQGFGHIVNTASMAAFMAAPLIASYGATKHALLGMSRALRVEGADFGVRVSVLCPGVVRTAILDRGGKYGKFLATIDPAEQTKAWERLRPMDPDRFATRALAAIARNRSIIVIPSWWRIIRWLNVLAPGLGDRMALGELRHARSLMRPGAAG